MKKQQGQTLIETIVAAFVLTMGIGAALGLANYSLGVSTNIRQQTIAIGLAREGIEVVKNIRDTNWLVTDLVPTCYNYETTEFTTYCYKEWLNPSQAGGQDIRPTGGSKTFILKFDNSLDQPWIIEGTVDKFGLHASPGGATAKTPVFYHSNSLVDAVSASSKFARKITISEDTFSPFNADNADVEHASSRLKVTSQVWWEEKNCPMTNDVVANSPCLITLETYLTNWKNF